MHFDLLLKGLILGLSVTAPMGPIGALCINRTINKNFTAGFVSGLGAATADVIYGLIAALGVTAITTFLIDQKLWIQFFGMLFLIGVGIKTIMKKENIEFKPAEDAGLLKDYFSTLILTFTNPLTVFFFIAVFGGFEISVSVNGYTSVILLLLGIFIGCCIWWIFLSGLTHKLKTRLNKRILKRIDLITGIIILFFGLLILVKIIKDII